MSCHLLRGGALLADVLVLDVVDELGEGHVEAAGNLHHVVECDVAPAVLHVDEVGAVDADHLRELTLSQVLLRAELGDLDAQSTACFGYGSFGMHVGEGMGLAYSTGRLYVTHRHVSEPIA